MKQVVAWAALGSLILFSGISFADTDEGHKKSEAIIASARSAKAVEADAKASEAAAMIAVAAEVTGREVAQRRRSSRNN